MSNRNVVKTYAPNCYYHVHTHGTSERQIYLDDADYRFFLSLFEQYLSKGNSVEVLAYCLMPNHFHLLLHQTANKNSVSRLMHSVTADYDRYFYNKYSRSGPLCEISYKTSQILSDEYLLHISRCIHLSPGEWIDYPNSSLRAYLYDDTPVWLNKTHIVGLYGSAVKYLKFLEDYQGANGR